MRVGGSAQFKGISLCTKDRIVSVNDKKIYVAHRKIGIIKTGLLDKIPVIRQVRVIIQNRSLWPLCGILITAQITMSLLGIHNIHNPTMLYMLPFILVAILIVRRYTDLFRFHGVEHKVIKCLELDEELTIENVSAASRVSMQCGSIFVIILFPLLMLSEFFPDPYILMLASVLIALELTDILAEEKGIRFLQPVKNFVQFIQLNIVTQEPTIEQIKLAIICAQELKRK